MALQGGEELTAGGIPQPGGAIPGGGSETFAVRAEGHVNNPIRMTFQGGEGFISFALDGGIPQLGSLIPGGGGKLGTVRAEGDSNNPIRMTFQGEEGLTAGGIPQPGSVIPPRGGGEEFAIRRAEGDGDNRDNQS